MKKDLANLSPNFKWSEDKLIEEGAIISFALTAGASKIFSGISGFFLFKKGKEMDIEFI